MAIFITVVKTTSKTDLTLNWQETLTFVCIQAFVALMLLPPD